MPVIYILIAVAVVVILWYISVYNRFKRLQVTIKEAWSGIDVQLKRKANIIPNLVDTLKMQMKFENDLLTKLTEARSGLVSGDRAEAMRANDAVSKLIPSIRAVAESYPELGTNKSFLKLMEDVRDCEDKVSFARNRYNMTVSRFNMDIQQIPASFVAGRMGLVPEPMFEIAPEKREEADNMRIGQL